MTALRTLPGGRGDAAAGRGPAGQRRAVHQPSPAGRADGAARPAHAVRIPEPGAVPNAGTGALRDVLPVTGRTPSLFRGLLCDARTCFQKSLNVADDENPRMLNYFGQATRPGYDTMTGLGTPAGQRFVTVLRQLEK